MFQGSSFSQYQISTKREARAIRIVSMISDYIPNKAAHKLDLGTRSYT